MPKTSKFAGGLDIAPIPVSPSAARATPADDAPKRRPGRPTLGMPIKNNPANKATSMILGKDAYGDAFARLRKEGTFTNMSALTTWLLDEYGKAPAGSIPVWTVPSEE